MRKHNRVLWVLQWIFGVYFIAVGIMHFIVPDGLPNMMAWMYELNDTVHVISGTAEILGGLGLILPGLTGIRPELTIAAAIGLLLVMLGAAVWHVGREEFANVGTNIFNAAVMGYIAYGRWKLAPFDSSESATA